MLFFLSPVRYRLMQLITLSLFKWSLSHSQVFANILRDFSKTNPTTCVVSAYTESFSRLETNGKEHQKRKKIEYNFYTLIRIHFIDRQLALSPNTIQQNLNHTYFSLLRIRISSSVQANYIRIHDLKTRIGLFTAVRCTVWLHALRTVLIYRVTLVFTQGTKSKATA